MITKLSYDSDNLDMIYNSLKKLKEHNNPRDYEIRIDGLSVIPRTNEVYRFYNHQDFMLGSSKEIVVLIYYGKSRLNDKYLLIHNQDFLSKEQYKKELEDSIKEFRKKEKLKRLIKKNKERKKQIVQLKAKVNNLESSSSKIIKDLFPMISSSLNKSTNSGIDQETQMILKIIKSTKDEFGEEVFNNAMKIGLTVARNPSITESVEQFIDEKLKENEK